MEPRNRAAGDGRELIGGANNSGSTEDGFGGIRGGGVGAEHDGADPEADGGGSSDCRLLPCSGGNSDCRLLP